MQGTHSPLAGRESVFYVKTAVPLHRNETNWQMFTQVFSSVTATFIIDYVLSIHAPTPVEEHHSYEEDLCLLLTLASAPTVCWHSNSFTADG